MNKEIVGYLAEQETPTLLCLLCFISSIVFCYLILLEYIIDPRRRPRDYIARRWRDKVRLRKRMRASKRRGI